ncbi:hypothetical protein WUBG_05995 [Wuchereria bancrofti]|uniref:Uncharacterized protein n=1 Tax=Wuchereria bancrofti TaxID=6293 RepID=J9EKX3_WUCBA|nr:hypothetical protein WUBG_05995 [Wuchereria bancrofti]
MLESFCVHRMLELIPTMLQRLVYTYFFLFCICFFEQVTSENIAKLFLAEAVVDSHGSRDRGGAAASVR